MTIPISPDQGSQEGRIPLIAIVGAGLAGLAAALRLQDAGFSYQIYEASDRPGGRVHSLSSLWAPGLVSEWCGEFIDKEHSTLLQLIERFDLETIDLSKTLSPQARSLLYFSQQFQHIETQDTRDFASLLSQQSREIGFPTTYLHSTEAGRQFDALSVYEWIERYIKGGHTVPLGKILDTACRGFYGVETTLQSSLNLIYMFSEMVGILNINDRLFLNGPALSSYKVVGGNQRLVESIAGALPPSSLHFGHKLIAIERTSSGSVTLSFQTSEGIVSGSFDHVVLALPFSTLRQVDYQRAGFD
ncbi:MAG TPA: FAD-dependent oxidoreductase, partial [Ktedonobacteraceae bacterium]|nr:FAD-dependent oxidoreductase [Ktedonobacteraceae bacterium]